MALIWSCRKFRPYFANGFLITASERVVKAHLLKLLIVYVTKEIRISNSKKTNCNNELHFLFEQRKCFKFRLLITFHKIVDLDTSHVVHSVGLSDYLSLFVYLSILRFHLYSISHFITPDECNILELKNKKNENKGEEKMCRVINDLLLFIICIHLLVDSCSHIHMQMALLTLHFRLTWMNAFKTEVCFIWRGQGAAPFNFVLQQ